MNKHLFGLITLTSVFFASCTMSDEPQPKTKHQDVFFKVENISYPRLCPVPPSPKLFKKKRLRALSPDAPNLRKHPYNFLGRIYNVKSGNIGIASNLDNGIINFETLLNDPQVSRHLFSTQIGKTKLHFSTFSNQEQFLEQQGKLNKVSSGFKLDLLLFSIGKLDTYTRIFQNTLSNNQDISWGELCLSYLDQKVGFETTDAAIRRIATSHIDESFLYNLYNTTLSNYVRENGSFVVSKYLTGGKFQVLYEGESQIGIDATSRNKYLGDIIAASLSWKGKDSLMKDTNIPLSIGLSFGSSNLGNDQGLNLSLSLFNHIRCYAQIDGGKVGTQLLPASLFNFTDFKKADLSTWFQSLDKNFAFVDVDERGLIPLSKFILEDNFRERLRREQEGTIPQKETLDIPSISISIATQELTPEISMQSETGHLPPRRKGMAPIVVLNTRFGDKLIIVDKDWVNLSRNNAYREYFDSHEHNAQLRETLNKTRSIFECSIATSPNYIEKFDQLDKSSLWIKFPFNFNGDNTYKYQNPKTNIWYIYDKETKHALSFYGYDDNYIIDMYGLSSWFENIPTKKISISALTNTYKIIGI